MVTKEVPVINIYWYELGKEPKRKAQASSGEIRRLCSELALIRDELSNSYRKKDIEDVARLCRFHYENFIFRVYSLRERFYDILFAITDIKRQKDGKTQKKREFIKSVLSNIEQKYPNVHIAFSHFNDLISEDIKTRNISTHETFVLLGMGAGCFDVEDLLINYDPNEKEGLQMHNVIKKALHEFTKIKSRHIQDIINVTLELNTLLSKIIRTKEWK